MKLRRFFFDKRPETPAEEEEEDDDDDEDPLFDDDPLLMASLSTAPSKEENRGTKALKVALSKSSRALSYAPNTLELDISLSFPFSFLSSF